MRADANDHERERAWAQVNEGTAVTTSETCGQHNCDTHGCRHKHGHERGINANRTAGTGAGMNAGTEVGTNTIGTSATTCVSTCTSAGTSFGTDVDESTCTGAGMHTGASVSRCRPECGMIAGKSAGTNASMHMGRSRQPRPMRQIAGARGWSTKTDGT